MSADIDAHGERFGVEPDLPHAQGRPLHLLRRPRAGALGPRRGATSG